MSNAEALHSAASALHEARAQARAAIDQQVDALGTQHPYLLDELTQLKASIGAFYNLTLALGNVGRAADKLLENFDQLEEKRDVRPRR